jgi:AcrR family transcriptional regulator
MEKKAILHTFARLFQEKGYHNTSIRDISKVAGIQGGALYYYIKSKEETLFEIGEIAINELLGQLEEISNADSTPTEKLKAAIKNQIKFFVNNFYETCVFLIETKALNIEYQQRYLSRRDRYEKIWREIINDGMKRGEFRRGDVKLMTVAILGMLNWLVIWFKPGKTWSSEDISQEFTEIILGGIQNRKRGNEP